jgi:hypothetical protein
MTRFIETITGFENDVLVPIDRIKYIYVTYKESWELHIVGDDGEWVEFFGKDNERLNRRYEAIKEIVNGK